MTDYKHKDPLGPDKPPLKVTRKVLTKKEVENKRRKGNEYLF